METYNLLIIVNATFEEEKCLYNTETRKPIFSGDYYHDKIDDKIDGFLQCLDYLGIPYDLDKIAISPSDPKFREIGFICED